jgi:hypothetical protein
MNAAPPFVRGLLAVLWVALFAIFFALRFDTSTRSYFEIDDQIVVWLVDGLVSRLRTS